MKKIVRLTESDISRIVRRVIMEQNPIMASQTMQSYLGQDRKKKEREDNEKAMEIFGQLGYQMDSDKRIRERMRWVENLYKYYRMDIQDKNTLGLIKKLLEKTEAMLMSKSERSSVGMAWNSFLKRNNLSTTFPTWEVMNLLVNPKQNSKTIIDTFTKNGSSTDFLRKLQEVLKSPNYDKTRQQLGLTTLPSSELIRVFNSSIQPQTGA